MRSYVVFHTSPFGQSFLGERNYDSRTICVCRETRVLALDLSHLTGTDALGCPAHLPGTIPLPLSLSARGFLTKGVHCLFPNVPFDRYGF